MVAWFFHLNNICFNKYENIKKKFYMQGLFQRILSSSGERRTLIRLFFMVFPETEDEFHS